MSSFSHGRERGEIITILTIGTFVVLGLAALASSLFLTPKNTQVTRTHASSGLACTTYPIIPGETYPTTPDGYYWQADCSHSCVIHLNTPDPSSDCPQNTTEQYVYPPTSNWCYGFDGGGRCMILHANSYPRGTPVPTQPNISATPAPVPSVDPAFVAACVVDTRVYYEVSSNTCTIETTNPANKGCGVRSNTSVYGSCTFKDFDTFGGSFKQPGGAYFLKYQCPTTQRNPDLQYSQVGRLNYSDNRCIDYFNQGLVGDWKNFGTVAGNPQITQSIPEPTPTTAQSQPTSVPAPTSSSQTTSCNTFDSCISCSDAIGCGWLGSPETGGGGKCLKGLSLVSPESCEGLTTVSDHRWYFLKGSCANQTPNNENACPAAVQNTPVPGQPTSTPIPAGNPTATPVPPADTPTPVPGTCVETDPNICDDSADQNNANHGVILYTKKTGIQAAKYYKTANCSDTGVLQNALKQRPKDSNNKYSSGVCDQQFRNATFKVNINFSNTGDLTYSGNSDFKFLIQEYKKGEAIGSEDWTKSTLINEQLAASEDDLLSKIPTNQILTVQKDLAINHEVYVPIGIGSAKGYSVQQSVYRAWFCSQELNVYTCYTGELGKTDGSLKDIFPLPSNIQTNDITIDFVTKQSLNSK